MPETPKDNMTMGNAKNVSYPSPYPEMFNGRMQPHESLPATKWHRTRNIDRSIQVQKNPYADPTQVSKGITSTTAGGSFTLYDKTGGTKILDYNPSTGVVTINGSLIATSSSTGTYTNITLAGTDSIIGTMINGFYGTPQITGGTFSSGNVNNPTIGTPQITGGTITTSSFSGTLAGTITYAPLTGTAGIGANTFAFQTKGGSALLVINIGGTNFTFAPTGTQ